MHRRLLFTGLSVLLVSVSIYSSGVAADSESIDALLERASANKADHDIKSEISVLLDAVEQSKANNYIHYAVISGRLADAYLSSGDYAESEAVLISAIHHLEKSATDKQLLPLLHNDLGRVYRSQNDKQRALKEFEAATELAAQYGNPELEASSIFNALLIPGSDTQYRNKLYRRTLDTTAKIANPENRGELQMRCGLLALQDFEATKLNGYLALAKQLLTNATSVLRDDTAADLKNETQGQLARVLALSGDARGADALYQTAIRGSLQRNNLHQLYRWYWEIARLKLDTKSVTDAVQYYELAVNAHQDLYIGAKGQRALENQPALYNEFLGLLLDKRNPQAGDFQKAIKTLEGLRTASIQDYFQDSCVAEARSTINDITTVIDDQTAIIYPLILNNTLRVILVTQSQFKQTVSKLDRESLLKSVNNLRLGIQNNDSRYLAENDKLYAALINPFEKDLTEKSIKHLVVVPDQITAAIPFASLKNDNHFLIEDYSLSIAPSIELTQLDEASVTSSKALYAGVSLPVFNLPALQRVRDEIAMASHFIPGETLLNTGFYSEAVAQKLAPGGVGVLHLASHSRIADNAEESFILTYNGKITLNNLRDLIEETRYSQHPIQLLSLSACSTAEGTNGAALGLAGLAVKSGAHSVLASLWAIDDQATAQLIAEFYKALAEGENKADALRKAQLSLLGTPRFENPNNWAAFVMVGDWH